jgi:hypothetical protein
MRTHYGYIFGYCWMKNIRFLILFLALKNLGQARLLKLNNVVTRMLGSLQDIVKGQNTPTTPAHKQVNL